MESAHQSESETKDEREEHQGNDLKLERSEDRNEIERKPQKNEQSVSESQHRARGFDRHHSAQDEKKDGAEFQPDEEHGSYSKRFDGCEANVVGQIGQTVQPAHEQPYSSGGIAVSLSAARRRFGKAPASENDPCRKILPETAGLPARLAISRSPRVFEPVKMCSDSIMARDAS
jgi:hypothetical protein